MKTIDIVQHEKQGRPNDYSRIPTDLQTKTSWNVLGRAIKKDATPEAILVYRAWYSVNQTFLYSLGQTRPIKKKKAGLPGIMYIKK